MKDKAMTLFDVLAVFYEAFTSLSFWLLFAAVLIPTVLMTIGLTTILEALP